MRALTLLLALTLTNCAWKDPTVGRYGSVCVEYGQATNGDTVCRKFVEQYHCFLRMPPFFYDSTVAICRDELECRKICDMYRGKPCDMYRGKP